MPKLDELQAKALALGIDVNDADNHPKTKATLTDEIAEAKADIGIGDHAGEVMPKISEKASVFDDDEIVAVSGVSAAKVLSSIEKAEELPPKKRSQSNLLPGES